MPNKERSGFGFVGDGLPQTGSAAFLLSARFTSAAYERVIRRIEWSAHITEKAYLTVTNQIYMSCVIFAGLTSPNNNLLIFDSMYERWTDNANSPEILYAQTLSVNGASADFFPIDSDVGFVLEAGREYTVAVSQLMVLDITAGTVVTTAQAGRTLNVFSAYSSDDALNPPKQHWR